MAALAALAPLQAGGEALVPLPRATADRPDDYAGLQLHAIYATPSDGPDRGFDTSGGIENSIASFQSWLMGQTGGRALRFDTYQGSVDITFVRLPRPDAEYAARGRNARDLLEQDLRAAGIVTSRKVYPVYFDVTNGLVCGGASWPPALPGTVAAFYLRSQIGGTAACFSRFAGPGEPPRYPEFAMLHDTLHDFGIVAPCSPHHHDAGHVNESPNDLMWSGSGSWNPTVLDVGRDDYFGAGIPGCPDLATAGFLTADADFSLTVTKQGVGTVTSSPWTVIDCGPRCSAPYPRGTVLTLAVAAAPGSGFAGWSGACSGTSVCTVTMDGPKSVTARFVSVTQPPPPAARCRVPRVVGKRLPAARTSIRRARCAVGRVRRARSKKARGRVITQRPRAGLRVRRGTRVNLTVSRGRR